MKASEFIAQSLPAIIENARFAPSVHNSQPWVVSTKDNAVVVELDRQHTLGAGDPTGRQTILSLGIFAEAVALSANTLGLQTQSVLLDSTTASITFTETLGAASAAEEIALLHKRASDRSIFRPANISVDMIKQLEQAIHLSGISVRVITERPIIEKIADLTGHGIKLAMSNPEFRKELSQYLVLPGSHKHRGIAVKSLYINGMLARLQPWMVRRGLSIGAEAVLEKKRWQSASAVVAILGDGDLSKYWFETGRTYLHVSLAIEKLGLSQATSAAIVEASNYHDDIEDLLGIEKRVLALIRIGAGSAKRVYSPRISADELLTSRS
jgi:hypothetical protein